MNIFEQLILLLTSLIANTLSAFSGGGAGLIQFPILIFLGLPFAIALATHKVATVALGLGAIMRYLGQGRLEWRFVLLLLVSGIPGVIIGANSILSVAERTAQIALGLLTGGLGLYSLFNRELGQQNIAKHRNTISMMMGGLMLFIIAIINGSLTSGSGLLVTLWLVLWFGFDYQRAVGYTLVMVGLFWNGIGAITLGLLTDIHWAWLPALFIGSLVGGYLGSHLAITQGNRWIKPIFEWVTLFIAVKLIMG